MRSNLNRWLIALVAVVFIAALTDAEMAQAQRRGSFGGSRSFGSSRSSGSSFGSSRGSSSSYGSGSRGSSSSYGSSRPGYSSSSPSSSSGSSYGSGSRSSSGSYTTPRSSGSSFGGSYSTSRPTFGGNALSSRDAYSSQYGVPRRVENIRQTGPGGTPQNYVVHSYGGYGDGFMTGYLTGRTSWMWSTPFHPAFYYSRPYYYTQPDGSVLVYPPTFSWGSFILGALILLVILYICYRIIRALFFKKKSGSTFGAGSGSFS